MFLIFMVLKLIGFIQWSWWWVTAPLWTGFAITIVIAIVAIAIDMSIKPGKYK